MQTYIIPQSLAFHPITINNESFGFSVDHHEYMVPGSTVSVYFPHRKNKEIVMILVTGIVEEAVPVDSPCKTYAYTCTRVF